MNTEPEIDKEEEEPSPVDEEEIENETAAEDDGGEPAADDGAEEAAGQEGSNDDGDKSADAEEVSVAEADDDDDDDSLGATCTIEDAGPCKKVVKATVPVEKVKKILAHNYEELSSTVRLPGFRRGRVPRRLLEKRFGEDLEKDVKESLLAESFDELLEDKDLKVLGNPSFDKIEFSPESDFTYEAELQVYPEFELPEYKGIEAESVTSEVEEGRFDEELEKLLKSRAEMVEVEPSKAGGDDQFIGSYELIEEGRVLKSVDQAGFVPASGNLEAFAIEELEKVVEDWDRSKAGTNDGAPLEIDVTVPAHYPDEVLRGREVLLRFVLEKTQTAELPELDDDFAKSLGAESAEDIKAKIEEQLQGEVERKDQQELEKKIVETLVDGLDLELPEDLIDRQRKAAEERIAQELAAEEKTEEEISEERAKAGEAAAEDLAGELKEFFLLEKIGEKEKIFATEDEVANRIQMMSMVYGVPPAAMMGQLQESGKIDEIRQTLRNEKVRSFLREKASIIGDSPQNNGDTEDSKADEGVEQD